MSLGLFDVLGPVMHGPSSNHTGGACRIGFLSRLIMGGQPDLVALGFHPAYMRSYKAQNSHVGLIAGCLGIREYDVDFPEALFLAEKEGMFWTAEPVEQDCRSRNTMRVTGRFTVPGSREPEFWSVNGDSIGGGSIVIDSVNKVPVYLTGNETVLFFFGSEEDAVSGAERAALELPPEDEPDQIFGGAGEDGRKLLFLAYSGREAAARAEKELRERLAEIVSEKTGEKLTLRVIPPIYEFGDTGRAPMVSDFAGLLELLSRGTELSDAAVMYEMRHSGVKEEQVLSQGRFLVSVIRDSLKRGESGDMKFIGGFADPQDGEKLFRFAETGRGSFGAPFTRALAMAVTLAGMNAAGTNRIVACPTGGAAGTLPAVLLTAAERYEADDERLARAFLVAGLVGVLIGGRASFSGTVGGCQSEVGIGAAMGAAGAVYLAGAPGQQAIEAAAIALKNVLGLSCDPPVPVTEVPCIKRNAMGVAVAFFAADLGMAGVRSAVTPDDVVEALADSQRRLPVDIKFGGRGGLAGTGSGKDMMRRWQERQQETLHQQGDNEHERKS